MKRLAVIFALAACLVSARSLAWAQEHEPAKAAEGKAADSKEHEVSAEEKEKAEKAETKDLIFKSINFVILFGLIIYFLAKPARDFFTSRTAAIQKGMADAKAAREAAEKRLAEIEQKLASLGSDISALRADAAKEDAVQVESMRKATEAEGAKILAAAESEIDTMARAARLDLKAFAAKLAVDLAEERIKGRMTPQAQGQLIETYVKDLSQEKAAGGRN
jgi:F-type H+-transporting ATPase subunit b